MLTPEAHEVRVMATETDKRSLIVRRMMTPKTTRRRRIPKKQTIDRREVWLIMSCLGKAGHMAGAYPMIGKGPTGLSLAFSLHPHQWLTHYTHIIKINAVLIFFVICIIDLQLKLVPHCLQSARCTYDLAVYIPT